MRGERPDAHACIECGRRIRWGLARCAPCGAELGNLSNDDKALVLRRRTDKFRRVDRWGRGGGSLPWGSV